MMMRGCGFLGWALVAVGCGRHGLHTSTAVGDAGPDASATDARPDGGDGRAPSDPGGPGADRRGSDSKGADADDDWTLPHAGGPVWRSSAVPYCNADGVFFSDLWSDSRGVYALGELESGLFFNSGTGWSRVSPQPSVLEHLTGIPGGPLLLIGGEFCGVTSFDGKTESCIAAVPGVTQVFVVSAQRAFAIVDDRLLSLAGAYFAPYGSMPAVPWPDAYFLWADAQVAVVAAEAGKVYVFDGPADSPQVLQIPDGAAATSLWGFGRDDVWVGGKAGRLAHFDGTSWTTLQAARGNCATISSLWGADHVLYFATDSTVGRVRNGAVDAVIDGPCAQDPASVPGIYEQVIIQKIWGNSPTELFIALYERKEHLDPASGGGVRVNDVPPDSCGQARMYWFDGQRLGRL
jgi:hypothetical protein